MFSQCSQLYLQNKNNKILQSSRTSTQQQLLTKPYAIIALTQKRSSTETVKAIIKNLDPQLPFDRRADNTQSPRKWMRIIFGLSEALFNDIFGGLSQNWTQNVARYKSHFSGCGFVCHLRFCGSNNFSFLSLVTHFCVWYEIKIWWMFIPHRPGRFLFTNCWAACKAPHVAYISHVPMMFY